MNSKLRLYIIISGFFLGFAGIMIGLFWETIINKQIEKFITISTDSPLYEVWHKPPMDVTTDFYMFNWTNPQDFQNLDIKPKFEELGPYRFKTVAEKVDIEWHPENSSVSYNKNELYYFRANDSKGSLDDVIVTINAVAVAVSTISQYMAAGKRFLAEMGLMIYPKDLTNKKTVDELLFTGYRDSLNNFLPVDRHGYCYGRNNTPKFFGTFNIHTGADNIKQVGRIHTWNKQMYSSLYPFNCSKISGSTGELFGPYLKKEDLITVFVRELCRDMPLEFDGISVLDGVSGFKYVGGQQAVDNGTLKPENACLCNGECLPSGVINISSCWLNSPLFVSYPHFYKADPIYLDQVDGLDPQQEKHEFYYLVDPKSSIGFELVARSQMNILVKPIKTSRMLKDVRKIMFPLFWIEIRARLIPKLMGDIRLAANAIFYGKIIAGIISTLSIIIAMCSLIIFQCEWREAQRKDVEEKDPVNEKDEENAVL